MTETYGQYLLNQQIPSGYKVDGAFTNKALRTSMTRLAKDDPQTYVKSIVAIKGLGDKFATHHGISVGLDDISPIYAPRKYVRIQVDGGLKKAAKMNASYLKGTEAALEKLGFTKNASAWTRFMDPMTGAGAALIRKAPPIVQKPLLAAEKVVSRVSGAAQQVGQRAGLIPPRPPPKFTTTEVSLSELPPDVLANYQKQHGGLAK
jgi:hypothetical protein